MSRITLSGRRDWAACPSMVAGTWILHLTNSTGVKTNEVKTPENAPVNQRAERGSSQPRGDSPKLWTVSRPILSKKKRLLVSSAAPTSGAEMPRYSPRTPSALIDWRKQSSGPLYLRGWLSGWDCRRTLIVSKGYSTYLPTMPASYREPEVSGLSDRSEWCQ